MPVGLPCPVTLAVNVTAAFWATFGEFVVTVVVVANGPGGGGGGGGGPVELPPPQPMIKLMMQIKLNPRSGLKSLPLSAQRRDRIAAIPLNNVNGQRGFDPKGKNKRLRFDAKVLCARAEPAGGDSVNVAGDVAPLARFTVEGCNEQE